MFNQITLNCQEFVSELVSRFAVFTSELKVELWKATPSLPSPLLLRIRLRWPLRHHLLLLLPWPVLLPLTCPLQIQLLCPLLLHYLLGSSWLQPYPRCLRSQQQCLTWQLHPWQQLPWRMPSLRSNLDFSSSRRSKFLLLFASSYPSQPCSLLCTSPQGCNTTLLFTHWETYLESTLGLTSQKIYFCKVWEIL